MDTTAKISGVNRPFITIALILSVLLMVTLIAVFIPGTKAKAAGIVSVDINPSIQIEVDANGNVLTVNALNDDAKKVLEKLNLSGLSLDAAVEAIIAEAKTQGFLTETNNSVLVTAAPNTDNPDIMNNLGQLETVLEDLFARIKGSEKSAEVLTVFVSDPTNVDNSKEDDAYSLGKQILWQYIQANNIAGVTLNDLSEEKIGTVLEKYGIDEDMLEAYLESDNDQNNDDTQIDDQDDQGQDEQVQVQATNKIRQEENNQVQVNNDQEDQTEDDQTQIDDQEDQEQDDQTQVDDQQDQEQNDQTQVDDQQDQEQNDQTQVDDQQDQEQDHQTQPSQSPGDKQQDEESGQND